ncbi:MAG: hypothetical protein M0Z43_02175 [Acidithiobacillus sp.]|nr:hypothetical protein [Acidithiobacillus sp.]
MIRQSPIRLSPGHILLTSGVGGPAAKWRDKLLTNTIISHQKQQQIGFVPTRSHAELITNHLGETFAARWRTRRRPNGLADYIGSEITIGRPAKSVGMTSPRFWLAWDKARMNRFDGDIYPVHKLLLQGIGTWIFPWLRKIGGGQPICSEIVSAFYHLGMSLFPSWRGWTPADLEREILRGDWFEVEFTGLLTKEIMKESGLPLYAEEAMSIGE